MWPAGTESKISIRAAGDRGYYKNRTGANQMAFQKQHNQISEFPPDQQSELKM